MNRISTRKVVLSGLMIALVFLATKITSFPGPIPPGYINFGDAIIMVTAVMMGRNSGLVAGAFGSALCDVLTPGGIVFAPVTFVVKGLEGFIVGLIAQRARDTGSTAKREIAIVTAIAAGAVIMVAGYFFAELYVLKVFSKTFGFAYAVGELPLNAIQGGISAVAGYLLTTLLSKTEAKRLFN